MEAIHILCAAISPWQSMINLGNVPQMTCILILSKEYTGEKKECSQTTK